MQLTLTAVQMSKNVCAMNSHGSLDVQECMCYELSQQFRCPRMYVLLTLTVVQISKMNVLNFNEIVFRYLENRFI